MTNKDKIKLEDELPKVEELSDKDLKKVQGGVINIKTDDGKLVGDNTSPNYSSDLSSFIRA